MARRRGGAKLSIVVVIGVLGLLFTVLAPAVHQAREAARRSSSRGHLKQWGLAVLNYVDVYDRLPPGGWVLEDGTERCSWVTVLLPYLEQSPIYNDLDRNRAWHHPRNQPICRTSLPTALYPDATQVWTTEGYGLVHYAVNSSLMHRNSSLKLDDIKAGTANTLLVGEAAGEFRPWACPWTWRTIESPMNTNPASYGHAGRDQTEFVLADGQLKTINNDIDPKVLRQMSSGGLVVNAEDIALPPIPAAYPSTKIKHRYHPSGKGDPWSPPPEWEAPESD